MRIYYALMATLNFVLVLLAQSTDNQIMWVPCIFTATVLFINCISMERSTALHSLILVGGIFNFLAVMSAMYTNNAGTAAMATYGSLLLFIGYVSMLADQHQPRL